MRLRPWCESGIDARYTIDWLENLPMSPFVWPDFVKTKIETATTRKFGLGDDGITLFSTDSQEFIQFARPLKSWSGARKSMLRPATQR